VQEAWPLPWKEASAEGVNAIVAAWSNKRKGQGRKKEKKKGGGGLDMTGAHMSRFSMATRLIRVRSSGRNRVTARLPSAAGANKSATRDGASAAVSGFTMSREVRPSTNQRHARTQKRRTVSLRPGRGPRRLQDRQLLSEAKIICDKQHLWTESRSNRPQETAKHSTPCLGWQEADRHIERHRHRSACL
jgi:hypothetical protein